jgi:hypothetical protein
MSNPLKRLSADQLRRLQCEHHMRVAGAIEQLKEVVSNHSITDLQRLEILGYRLYTSARDLAAIDTEVVERDMLEALPDATGPEELAQLMQFIH